MLVDLRFGTGGGGISVRFSGDTEAFSSDPSVDVAGSGSKPWSADRIFRSSTSLRTCDTMAGLGPVFRRWGLVMGELLMLALPLALTALFFRAFLERSWALGAGAMAGASRSISMGELLECVLWS